MEILLLVFLCVLAGSEVTSGAGNETVVTVDEGSDAILPCSLSTKDITSETFEWKKDGQKQVFLYDEGDHSNIVNTDQDRQFRGEVQHFPDKLTSGDASIIIRHTRLVENGNYTCEFPNLQPSQIFHIQLIVYVKAPLPSVRIRDHKKFSALLQCDVGGASPKPEVHWEDGAGNKLPAEKPVESERGGLYYITLLTTVTRTDTYRCVVTQKEINHQTHDEIDVKITGLTGGEVAGIVIGVLLILLLVVGGVVLVVLIYLGCIILNCSKAKPSIKMLEKKEDGALLQCKVPKASPKPELHWEDAAGNTLLAEEPVVTRRGHSSVIKATVNKTGTYYCVVKQKEINHQVYAGIHVEIPGSTDTTGGREKTVIRVEEGSDVILPCSLSTKEDITSEKFVWKKESQVFLYDGKDHSNNTATDQHQQFKDRVQHSPDKLKSGDASITIRDIKEADSGVYSCEFPDHPGQIFPVQLVVAEQKFQLTKNRRDQDPTKRRSGGAGEEVRIPLMSSNGDQSTADTRV